MTESAEAREQALRPHLDQARRQVTNLEAEIRGHEEDARAAFVRGDAAGGGAYHEKAAGLKPALAAAGDLLRTLEDAARALGEQRQREAVEARYAGVCQAHAEAVAEAQRQAAEVRPALAAARHALRLALQAEDLTRRLEGEVYELEIHLGMRERGKFRPNANAVRAMLESQPYLHELLRLDV